jgi:hypothetical protein
MHAEQSVILDEDAPLHPVRIDGITYRPMPGRPRQMEPTEISEKILPVVHDPKLADRHHWTAIALRESDETTTAKKAGLRVCLVLDNTSCHKIKRLVWHHSEPICLPTYSPDFNPIERILQHLTGHGIAG